jgi:hypothetical protein
VNATDGRIAIETNGGPEARAAWELATTVLADFDFR